MDLITVCNHFECVPDSVDGRGVMGDVSDQARLAGKRNHKIAVFGQHICDNRFIFVIKANQYLIGLVKAKRWCGLVAQQPCDGERTGNRLRADKLCGVKALLVEIVSRHHAVSYGFSLQHGKQEVPVGAEAGDLQVGQSMAQSG